MSSPNNNNKEQLSKTQEELEQEQKKQQEQKKAQQKAKKTPSWSQQSSTVKRSAGVDFMKASLPKETLQDETKTSIYNLPQQPDFIAEYEFIPTGSNNLDEVITTLGEFFQECSLFNNGSLQCINEKYNIHGSYCNQDLSASTRFSIFAYRTPADEVTIHLHRVDGCGIAFARLFNELNQSLGSDKERIIATFEAPKLKPLSELEKTKLEQQFTNLSLSTEDTCVFEHSIQSPITWALDTIDNMLASLVTTHMKQQDGAADEVVILPLNDDDDDDDEIPLPPRAQAQMLTQSFNTLNSGIISQAQDDFDKFQTTPQFQQIVQFAHKLFSTINEHNQITYLDLLLTHPHLDVAIVTVQFLSFAVQSQTELVAHLPQLLQELYFHSLQQTRDETIPIEPFDYLNHDNLARQIEQLWEIAGVSPQ